MLYQESPRAEAKVIVLANLFRGIEAVGGVLRVTAHALDFQPHPMNFQRDPLTVPLADIFAVEPAKTFGWVKNGVLVRLHDGREYKFVAWNRDALIARIRELLPAA